MRTGNRSGTVLLGCQRSSVCEVYRIRSYICRRLTPKKISIDHPLARLYICTFGYSRYFAHATALHVRLGVREQKYECSQNIAVRSTFVRHSRSIIDGPYTNEPFVRSSYYVPLLTIPFVRCWKLIWVIERPEKIRRTIIVTDLEHRGRKSLLKQMVQCVCRVFLVHASTASGSSHLSPPPLSGFT